MTVLQLLHQYSPFNDSAQLGHFLAIARLHSQFILSTSCAVSSLIVIDQGTIAKKKSKDLSLKDFAGTLL